MMSQGDTGVPCEVIVQDAADAGVTHIVTVSTTLADTINSIAIAKRGNFMRS